MGLGRDAHDFDLGAQSFDGAPQTLSVVTKDGLAEDMGFKSGDKLISAGGHPHTRGPSAGWRAR